MTIRRLTKDSFEVTTARGVAQVGYLSASPEDLDALASDLRERAARYLQSAQRAEEVARWVRAEETEQGARDEETRRRGVERAAETRARKKDPFGLRNEEA